jgi:hypothetical protein
MTIRTVYVLLRTTTGAQQFNDALPMFVDWCERREVPGLWLIGAIEGEHARVNIMRCAALPHFHASLAEDDLTVSPQRGVSEVTVYELSHRLDSLHNDRFVLLQPPIAVPGTAPVAHHLGEVFGELIELLNPQGRGQFSLDGLALRAYKLDVLSRLELIHTALTSGDTTALSYDGRLEWDGSVSESRTERFWESVLAVLRDVTQGNPPVAEDAVQAQHHAVGLAERSIAGAVMTIARGHDVKSISTLVDQLTTSLRAETR